MPGEEEGVSRRRIRYQIESKVNEEIKKIHKTDILSCAAAVGLHLNRSSGYIYDNIFLKKVSLVMSKAATLKISRTTAGKVSR